MAPSLSTENMIQVLTALVDLDRVVVEDNSISWTIPLSDSLHVMVPRGTVHYVCLVNPRLASEKVAIPPAMGAALQEACLEHSQRVAQALSTEFMAQITILLRDWRVVNGSTEELQRAKDRVGSKDPVAFNGRVEYLNKLPNLAEAFGRRK